MKKFCRIYPAVSAGLVMLVSLVFVVLEGTLLFTGDFLLYEWQLLAFLQRILRFLLPAAAFAVGLLFFLKRQRSFLPESLTILLCTAAAAPFIGNSVGFVFIAIAALFIIGCLLRHFTKE